MDRRNPKMRRHRSRPPNISNKKQSRSERNRTTSCSPTINSGEDRIKISTESNLENSKMATSSCKGLVSVSENEKFYFRECFHIINENTTLRCGTQAECVDHSGCTKDHTLLCKACYKSVPKHFICDKMITLLPGKSHPFVECGQTHIIVDEEETRDQSYFCGQSFSITDVNICTVQQHRIYCTTCQEKHLTGRGGLNRSFGNSHLTTSTPKVVLQSKASDSKFLDDKDTICNQTLSNIKEIQKDVNNALNDIDCRSSHHMFESRTRKFLSAPGRKFMNAHRACLFHFSSSQKLISKQFGDEILQNLKDAFNELQKIREYCLEPFTEQEIIENGYDNYLNEKLDLYNEALQLHDQYFNAHIIEQESLHRSAIEQIRPPFSFQNPVKQPQLHVSQPSGLINKLSNLNMQNPVSQEPIRHEPLRSEAVRHEPLRSEEVRQESRSIMNRNPFQYMRNSPIFKVREELANVKKFDASEPRKYMAFRAQWQNYEIKANQAKRSEIDKYYDLINVLEGKAHDLVQTDYPNHDSYTISINLLDEMYYHPVNLLRDMCKKVTKVGKMSDTYQSLLEGTISLRQAWSDLNHANLTVEQLKGLFLISSTEKSLSEGAWKIWLETQNDPKFIRNGFECFDINNYMQSINTAMINAQRKENAIGKSVVTDSNKFKPRTQQSTLYGSYNVKVKAPEQGKWKKSKVNISPQKQATINGRCVFCKGEPHRYQLNCKRLKDLSPQDILKILRQYNIKCYMCLSLGHTTRDCEATNVGILSPCRVKLNNVQCGKFHCRYLHGPSNEKPSANITISNENVEQPTQNQN